jgi:hypothetical protein
MAERVAVYIIFGMEYADVRYSTNAVGPYYQSICVYIYVSMEVYKTTSLY